MGGVCSGGAALRGSDDIDYPQILKGKNCFNNSSSNNKDSLSSRHYSDFDAFQRNNYDCVGMLLCSPVQPTSSKTVPKNKVQQSFGVVGSEEPPGVSEALGSTMLSLKCNSTFVSGTSPRGSDISIFAFEIACTVTKGANLFRALSTENLHLLKEKILHLNGVQQLVSTDMVELLRIAAADKREEFDNFLKEVVRFGNLCKDPQWHNLGLYFEKLHSDVNTTYKTSKEDAKTIMDELQTLAQYSSELYHELHALDKFEREYRRKLEEVESSQILGKGDSLMMLNMELNQQRKLVRSLKSKSLWSKNLDEVIEKLVEVVKLIHQEISEAFNGSDDALVEPLDSPQRLGTSGLALHYANIISQIEEIMCVVSRPYSLPPNARDRLYHGLPSAVKAGLRSQLQIFQSKELTELQIRAEMEKTLHWLIPIAATTAKSHQGFGTVGEWATSCKSLNWKSAQNNYIRLQTLYHADKKKTESYILELVALLHYLMSQLRQKYYGLKPIVPGRPLKRKELVLQLEVQPKQPKAESSETANHILKLSQVDQELSEEVRSRRSNPGTSKSRELSLGKEKIETVEELSSRRCSSSTSIREDGRTTDKVDIADRFEKTSPN